MISRTPTIIATLAVASTVALAATPDGSQAAVTTRIGPPTIEQAATTTTRGTTTVRKVCWRVVRGGVSRRVCRYYTW